MEHVLPDERRVATVCGWSERGYAERMVLSHDAAFYSHVTPPAWRARTLRDGTWSHLRDILPRCAPGEPEADLEQMLVTNPGGCSRPGGEGGAARRTWAHRHRRRPGAPTSTGRSASPSAGRTLRVRPHRVPRGMGAPRYPWVMGHEAFGIIEAVGPALTRRGWVSSSSSSRTSPAAHASVVADGPRRARAAVGGHNRPGALAEKVVVPADRAWPAEPRRAGPRLRRALAVSETALRRLPGALPPEALVIGAGAQGLLCARPPATRPPRACRGRQPGPGRRSPPGSARSRSALPTTCPSSSSWTPRACQRRSAVALRGEVGATIVEWAWRPPVRARRPGARAPPASRARVVDVRPPGDFQRTICWVERAGREAGTGHQRGDHRSPMCSTRSNALPDAPGKTWIRRLAGVSRLGLAAERHGSTQAEQVAVDAEPGDPARGDVREHRDRRGTASRAWTFDMWTSTIGTDRIARASRMRVAVVGPGAGVDDDGRRPVPVRARGSARTSRLRRSSGTSRRPPRARARVASSRGVDLGQRDRPVHAPGRASRTCRG